MKKYINILLMAIIVITFKDGTTRSFDGNRYGRSTWNTNSSVIIFKDSNKAFTNAKIVAEINNDEIRTIEVK